MVEKPNFDKVFKGSKMIKTVVKTVKYMPIEFYKILNYFIFG